MNLILTTLTSLLFISPSAKTGPGKGVLNPVHWLFRAEPTKDKKTYLVHCTAIIDDSWHIYAQVQPESAISEPTKFKFVKTPLVIFKGTVKEKGIPEKQILQEAGIEQNIYKKTVDFVQEVSLKDNINPNTKTTINGTVTFQACTDEMCLPPGTESFSISL